MGIYFKYIITFLSLMWVLQIGAQQEENQPQNDATEQNTARRVLGGEQGPATDAAQDVINAEDQASDIIDNSTESLDQTVQEAQQQIEQNLSQDPQENTNTAGQEQSQNEGEDEQGLTPDGEDTSAQNENEVGQQSDQNTSDQDSPEAQDSSQQNSSESTQEEANQTKYNLVPPPAGDDKITIYFVKENEQTEAANSYFNVLKIRNNTPLPVSGRVGFAGPDQWDIVSFDMSNTEIKPGDILSVPVRIAIPNNAQGGLAYTINGSFRTKDYLVSASSYITLPTKKQWRMSTNEKTLFFSESADRAEFKVRIENKGNTKELIKLTMDVGKLLYMENTNGDQVFNYIELPPYADTSFSYFVYGRKKLSAGEQQTYQNSWKESAVRIQATTDDQEESTAILVKELNSVYENERERRISPVNFSLTTYNLLSTQLPRFTVRTFGLVLFDEVRKLNYMVGANNLFYHNFYNAPFEVKNQLSFNIHFYDRDFQATLSNQINSPGAMHSFTGMGVRSEYDIDDNNKLQYAAAWNLFSDIRAGFVGYKTKVSKFGINTGLTYEDGRSRDYTAYSAQIGSGVTFLGHHNIGVTLLGSSATYMNLQGDAGRDTTVFGFSYNAQYGVRYRDWYFRLNNLNSEFNILRNSGINRYLAEGEYRFNEDWRLKLNASRFEFTTVRYPSSFFVDGRSEDRTDVGQLFAFYNRNKKMYQFGPLYSGINRKFLDQPNDSTIYASEYASLDIGLRGAINFRLSDYRSLTPSLIVQNLRFRYVTENPDLRNFEVNDRYVYRFGVNYFDGSWKVNVAYSSGSSADLFRNLQVIDNDEEEPQVSQSLQSRVAYERSFNQGKTQLQSFVNYAYFTPSGRETLLLNSRLDQKMDQGWRVYVSGNVFSNSRVDDENGRISSRNLNFIVGIIKALDLQQPSIKYYDLNAVLFHDLNANGIKEDEEPPVSNVMMNIRQQRGNDSIKRRNSFAEIDLITNLDGEIVYKNLPKDNYELSFTPMENLKSLYFVNTTFQNHFHQSDAVHYVPLAESYKIKGKIILERDPNSSEGNITPDNVRVSAEGPNGETYSALSDLDGSFVINVPQGSEYKISVRNVFGEYFSIENTEYTVNFSANKSIYIDFVFFENKRDVKFGGDTQIYNFKSLGN